MSSCSPQDEKARLSTSSASCRSLETQRVFRQRHRPVWLRRGEKEWLERPRSRDQKWARLIVLFGMGLGMVLCTTIVVAEYLRSNRASYRLILHEKFSGEVLSKSEWIQEQQLGGYVEGSFDITTDSAKNCWVEDGMLHLMPTVAAVSPDLSQLNLQTSGQCTSSLPADCIAMQNSTAKTAIPNIQTARIRSVASITYGRVEVVAKLPKGDWIFSTIGLDPTTLIYGQFPASGQIDITQVRGNKDSFSSGGINKADTVVHFGADGMPYSDCAELSRNSIKLKQTDFSAKFHTFGLEWTPDFIRTWFDHPSNTILNVKVDKGFWRKAAYSDRYKNDVNFEYLADPWTNGTRSAPYDQPFHLTLRTNVGAVSGIFADDPAKPWYDAAGRGASMTSFQNNQTWLQSWGVPAEHTMYIKEVKMWQQVM